MFDILFVYQTKYSYSWSLGVFQPWVLGNIYSIRYLFALVKLTLYPVKKWLFTPQTFMPLLNTSASLAMPVLG